MRRNINDLYFGCIIWDPNHKELKEWNLFNSVKVLRSIASYRILDKEAKQMVDDPVRYCFGDLWSRVQYEMQVGEPFGDKTEKTDIFTMCVLPNKDYLMELVNSVSVSSARKWHREYWAMRNGQ